MNIFIKIIASFLFTLVLFFAQPVFSAEIFFGSDRQSFSSGEEFLVPVFLNTKNESVNAVEGKIIFPADLLEVKEIRDGNSIINFWIEKPSKGEEGITFSGITPGGFLGQKEFLFSIVFKTKAVGSGTIKADRVRVLLNDGLGTLTKVEVSDFQFLISQKISSTTLVETIKDTEQPEDFKPIITNDQNIFDGKYFLVFATQDKGSGIEHYEVREGWWSWYKTVDSPYLLKHQSIDRKIYIKAVDKNGNQRVVIVYPENMTLWYKQYKIFGIIILLISIAFWFKRKWLRFLQS